jgi:tight adherence protein C
VRAALPLLLAALLLGAKGAAELLRSQGDDRHRLARRALSARVPGTSRSWGELARALGLSERLARAGFAERVAVATLLAAKAAAAVAGAVFALILAPAAPGRLAIVLAVAMPAAGFLAPDAWLERRARARLRRMRSALPDALDLVAVGAGAGRPPLDGMAEIARGEGPLAEELARVVAEAGCGISQRRALDLLRQRAPVPEVAALCALIERSHRFGSPLADQLHQQASEMRSNQRRRIEERAARAAPKIQLAVALLLVPSVLLMIGAGLLANLDRFLVGF